MHFCGGCAEKEQNGCSNGDSKAAHSDLEEREEAALVKEEENGEILNEKEQYLDFQERRDEENNVEIENKENGSAFMSLGKTLKLLLQFSFQIFCSKVGHWRVAWID